MAVDVRGFNLGIDVSPITKLMDSMGQERKLEQQQGDIAALLGRARAGDSEALNQLAVHNPNLGNFAQGQVTASQKAQARQESEMIANMIDMPVEQRAQYASDLYEKGLMDQEDFDAAVDLLGRDEATQNAMLTNMVIGLGDSEFLKSRGIGGKVAGDPASIREYQYVQSLSDEERELYFKTKRGDNSTPEQRFKEAQQASDLAVDEVRRKEERKQGVKYYNDIAERGRTATSQLGMVNRLATLNETAISGTGAGLKLQAIKMADGLGLPTDGVSDSELMEAISNELTLDKSQKMSGALSENDMVFLQRTVPMLSQSKEGRAKVIEYNKKLLAREREYSQAAKDFRKANGYFDLGEFNSEFDVSNKPLFSDEAGAAMPTDEAPANETPEQKLKRLRSKYKKATP